MTDGNLVGIFKETIQSGYQECSDKRIFFDLHLSGEFDRGTVLIISETKLTNATSVKIYGKKDPGTQIKKHTSYLYFFATGIFSKSRI